MTTPEGSGAPVALTDKSVAMGMPLEAGDTRPAGLLVRQVGQWVARRGWIHVLLLTGVAICVYPFLWMVMTSIKTDDELSDTGAAPSLPTFKEHSPYVRAPARLELPEDVPASRFLPLEQRLLGLTTEVVLASLPTEIPRTVDKNLWARSAASLLVARVISQIPKQAWSESTDSILSHFRGLLTPESVGIAISDQLSRFELSALTLRTLDGHLFKLTSGPKFAETWHLESKNGALEPLGDATRLDYEFGSSSDEPVVLVSDFTLPAGVAPSALHKLILSIRADDSWHRLDATLDVGRTHWESSRTTYLAHNRAYSIVFQPPTFDDTTIRAHTWVSLAARGPSDRDNDARLRIVISPSSTLHAIWGKVFRNYLRAFSSAPIFRYVGNSLILVALTIFGATFSSAFVAYAFARLHWPGRGAALLLLLSTMMIPSQVTMIPSFLVWRGLGWYNTLNPLWVPAWFGNAFFIFLMVQHMKTIPKELEEAAKIDGLNVVQTWWYVIVPQLRPTLAAVSIMSFLGAWNEFLGPLIYLRDQSKFPLSLGLFGMRVDQGADWSMIMAGNILMTVPSIVVFFAFQRYFIEGMTVSGMKA